MGLRSGEMPGEGQSAAEAEAGERTADDNAAAQLMSTPAMSTPAAGKTADDMVPDDVVPDDMVPDDMVPDDMVPDDMVPDDMVPDDHAEDDTDAGPDQQLLSADAELLARWQRVQAGFVDDPQVAVADAADLLEQAGQALVDALRQMRTTWDRGSADGPAAAGDIPADTEQLRQMMQRYRALFNHLYQAA